MPGKGPRWGGAVWAVPALLLPPAIAGMLVAQEPAKKDDKKPEPPEIQVAVPAAIVRGTTTKVAFRGKRLDTLKDARAEGEGVTFKIVGKDKTGVPNQQDVARTGDTQFRTEIVLPADFAADVLPVVPLGDPDGKPYPLRVLAPEAALPEKEPNDGFAQAQPVEVGKTVIAQFHQPQNPDVYRLAVKPGERIAVEVVAWRLGGACDPFVTLYDPAGRVLVAVDDGERLPGTPQSTPREELARDVRIVWESTFAGDLRIVVQDALDQGGPAHPYLLHIRPEPRPAGEK